MKPGARISAAIEVLAEVIGRHRPAAEALADWGKAHRFAGSGDRAAIGHLVFEALRRKNSIAWRMETDTARALAFGAAGRAFGMAGAAVAALADGSEHAPAPLTEAERHGLDREVALDAPAHVRGDFPEWLTPSLDRAFGGRTAEEGAALARRAPVDLRANTLKADREKVVRALAKFGARETALSPIGVRIEAPDGTARLPNVEAEPGHAKGWFEVQDEGSQLAALLAHAGPRQQVLDICAGAGGKTLALAAAMQNTGQIYAYDDDRLRLRAIFERLKRAGARNVQVLQAGEEAGLTALGPRFDLVLVDAPCTGSGIWRRRPESKWRLKPESLGHRQRDQDQVLALAARMVKPGGRLVYVTCSILPEENGDRIEAFRAAHADFAVVPFAETWAAVLGTTPPASADGATDMLQLTPARHGVDGFFIAGLKRGAAA